MDFASRLVPPNSFIAGLIEAQSIISGSTSENDSHADIAQASIDGVRSGARLQFTKQYRGPRMRHAVEYSGMINAVGTEVSGTWHFATRLRRYSGDFSMTRELFDDLEVEEEQEVEEPVG